MTGWNYPYQQWTQDLKDQYAYNVSGAKALLSAAGYSTGFDTNVVASTASDLTLLQIVQSYLAQVNINMSIRTMDPAAWISFVRAHKHDQLAYGGNSSGFSFPPLFGFNRWATNATFSWANVSDPAWDNLRSRALAAPTTAETQALLVEANKYMVDKHWVISLVTPNYFALYQPWLKGFNAQNFSISGGGASGSPLFVGFYTARFWIDTSLKKSMGH
jgi:ABC-type transport system substrate-binding protein